MRKIWLKLSGVLAILLVTIIGSLYLFTQLQAKTTVTQDPSDECKFKVTVEVAFAFIGEDAQKKADDLIKTWTDAMNKFWNGPTGAGQTFGECDCKATFEFIVQKLDAGKDCRQAPAGFHCINVVSSAANQRGNVADAHTVPPDGSTNGFGEWTIGASGVDAAHEMGHLMGLDDEYKWEDTNGDGKKEHVNLNVQKNADGSVASTQSIMATTSGDVAVLPEHVEDIALEAGYLCPNSCCCGNGKVDSDVPVMEDCDPTANPNGCAENQVCLETCFCEDKPKEPKCGDGEITPPEQCDDAAFPTGCLPGYDCKKCICEKKPEPAAPESPTPQPQPEKPQEQPGEDTTTQPDTTTPPSGPGTTPAPEPQPEPEPAPEPSGPVCGDGICAEGESCDFCSEDCGVCEPTGPICGDGLCEEFLENCELCPGDCGVCEPTGPMCGDGVCEGLEQCDTCPADCGTCPVTPVCGDGYCDPSESCNFCPVDCGICLQKFKCQDGIDNDGDGLIDYPEDPGCSSLQDNDEYNPPPDPCGNGLCEPHLGEDPTICPIDCEPGPVDL